MTALDLLAERGFDRRNLVEPRSAMLGAAIVAPLPQEPLVVLAGTRPVVLDLLVKLFLVRLAHKNFLNAAACE
jgi:hypothetical protein